MKKSIKKFLKDITKSEKFIKILSYLIYLYGKLVFKTCKWTYYGKEKFFNTWDKEKALIGVAWHGRVIMFPYLMRKDDKVNALVSLHQDGQIMANFLRLTKIDVIGGSTSQNAKGAAVNLMNSIKNNVLTYIVPDGPCGPNMKMTDSPIYFAQKSGKPIFAMVYSVKSHKLIKKAWDQMMLPFPFSSGIISFIGPFHIPADASKEELEKYKLEIETKMNNTLLEMDKKLGVEKVEIGKMKQRKHKRI